MKDAHIYSVLMKFYIFVTRIGVRAAWPTQTEEIKRERQVNPSVRHWDTGTLRHEDFRNWLLGYWAVA